MMRPPPLLLCLPLVACRPDAPPTVAPVRPAVEVDTEAPLPAPAPSPAPVASEAPPTPDPAPAPSVEPPFSPNSPDADRDPFRSDSVDQNREGEYILDRALTPPKQDAPEPAEKEDAR